MPLTRKGIAVTPDYHTDPVECAVVMNNNAKDYALQAASRFRELLAPREG